MTFLVDGKRVRPSRVNTSFAGTPLSPGEHEIHLLFEAPGKRLGILLSLTGVIGWAAASLAGAASGARLKKFLSSGASPR